MRILRRAPKRKLAISELRGSHSFVLTRKALNGDTSGAVAGFPNGHFTFSGSYTASASIISLPSPVASKTMATKPSKCQRCRADERPGPRKTAAPPKAAPKRTRNFSHGSKSGRVANSATCVRLSFSLPAFFFLLPAVFLKGLRAERGRTE